METTQNTQNIQASNVAENLKKSTAKKANAKKPTVKIEKTETSEIENVVASVEKIKVVRKTTDEKVVELKVAIARQFNLTENQIINFTITRLAKSKKKVNLVDFYESLIVELVTKPETLDKF